MTVSPHVRAGLIASITFIVTWFVLAVICCGRAAYILLRLTRTWEFDALSQPWRVLLAGLTLALVAASYA